MAKVPITIGGGGGGNQGECLPITGGTITGNLSVTGRLSGDGVTRLRTGSYIWDASSENGAGYIKFAQIQLSPTVINQDRDFHFEITRRRELITSVDVLFANDNTTDPALASITCEGPCEDIYINKVTNETGKWDLYILKQDAVDHIYITDFVSGCIIDNTGTDVAWLNTLHSSLPSTAIKASVDTPDFKQGTHVWKARGVAGQTGYVKIAELEIIGGYCDSPIEFTIAGRAKGLPTRVMLKFQTTSSFNPDLSRWVYYGGGDSGTGMGSSAVIPYLVHTNPGAASTVHGLWEIYTYKDQGSDPAHPERPDYDSSQNPITSPYNAFDITEFYIPGYDKNSIKWTWTDVQVSSLPSGGVWPALGLRVKSAAEADVAQSANSATQATTATSANQLANARTFTVQLNSEATGSFNGTDNVTMGVTNVLPVGHGGTGNSSVDSTPTQSSTKMVTSGGVYNALSGKANSSHSHSANDITSGTLGVARGGTGQSNLDNVTVGKAKTLNTARKLKVSLANNTTDRTFDGSAPVEDIPVTGTLPVANGGTGLTSLTGTDYTTSRVRGISLTTTVPASITVDQNGHIFGVYYT